MSSHPAHQTRCVCRMPCAVCVARARVGLQELRQHPTNLVLLLSICDFMFALKVPRNTTARVVSCRTCVCADNMAYHTHTRHTRTRTRTHTHTHTHTQFAITSILPNSISYQDITAYCIGQAVWAQFWGMASISWNGIISLNLMANLRKPFLDTSKVPLLDYPRVRVRVRVRVRCVRCVHVR